MSIRALRILILITLHTCYVAYLFGEGPCSESQGQAAAENRVATEFKRSTPIAMRRGDLEQSLVGFQFLNKYGDAKKTVRMQVPCIQIYEVVSSGFHVTNGVVDAVTVNLDDEPSWLVAYSGERGETFGLYGFSDAKDGFNGLMRLLDLKPLGDSDQGLDFFLTYSKLAYHGPDERVVNDDLGLMNAALDYFRDNSKTRDFQAFWRQCPQSVKQHVARPTISAVGKQFHVAFFTFEAGIVRENSLFISRDYQISDIKSKIIFTWGLRRTNGQAERLR